MTLTLYQIIATGIIFMLCFVLVYSYKPFQIQGFPRFVGLSVFLFKILFILLNIYIYTAVYENKAESDIYKYFQDGSAIASYAYDDFSGYLRVLFGFENEKDLLYLKQNTNHWFKAYEEFSLNENRLIIRFHALLGPLTQNAYPAHAILASFLSYIGSLLLHKSWRNYFSSTPKLWLAATFLVPSLLFWTGAVLKESFVILGLGLCIYGLFATSNKLYTLVGLLLILFSKEYIFIAILPLIAAHLIQKHLKPGMAQSYLLSITLSIIVIFLISRYSSLDFFQIIHKKQEAFMNVSNLNNAQSRFEVPIIQPNLYSILLNSPHALFNALFRPLIWEWKSVLYFFSGMEVMGIIGLGFYAMWTKKIRNAHLWKLEPFWFSLYFTVILCLMIGLTVDNSGSIARYRMPIITFVLAIFLLLLQKNKTDDLVSKV